jgi:glycosyltransferase involved in cell wall biosynthesis
VLSSISGVTAVSSKSREALSGRGAPVPREDRPIRVLILVPSLAVGGAETDLVRTLPRIDRTRFQVTVCTFLERGELGKVLQDQGIDVIGPFSASLYRLRQFVRRIAQQISSLLKRVPLAAKIGIGLSMLQNGLRTLRLVIRPCFKGLRALYASPRAVAYLLDVVRLARPIARYIRTSEVDIVHTILPNSYLIGACASVLAGRRPILMSRVSLNLYQQEDRLVGFIERRVLHRTVDAAIGNSNAVLRDLSAEGINESKLRLVYNGIDAGAFTNEMVDRSTARRLLGISDGALVFSVVANLHPYKGHRDLLPALAALSDALHSDWLCLIVGKDVHDHLPELRRLCLKYGLSRNVRFLGPRRDVPIILSASDIHISASHQEGLPNNIIEAMCARLPVVATAVGGVPELVVDGQTGYLLPPQDAGRMTGALVALAQAPIRRNAFGEAGYARAVSHFSIDHNVVAFESIYASLAGGRRHDRSLSRSL